MKKLLSIWQNGPIAFVHSHCHVFLRDLVRFPEEMQHCYCSSCRKLSGAAWQTWMPIEDSNSSDQLHRCTELFGRILPVTTLIMISLLHRYLFIQVQVLLRCLGCHPPIPCKSCPKNNSFPQEQRWIAAGSGML